MRKYRLSAIPSHDEAHGGSHARGALDRALAAKLFEAAIHIEQSIARGESDRRRGWRAFCFSFSRSGNRSGAGVARWNRQRTHAEVRPSALRKHKPSTIIL